MKKIHIISGGTMMPIATHLSLCAPAHGNTGMDLESLCLEIMPELEVERHETRMATGCYNHSKLVTNNDVLDLVNELKADPDTKIVFMPVALCDFIVTSIACLEAMPDGRVEFAYLQNAEDGGKRLSTHDKILARDQEYDPEYQIQLYPAPKIIPRVREKRKDIFLVGFKTTDGATEDEQYIAGLGLLKGASCNLVFANDVKTKTCMVITPEEARYHVTKDRHAALTGLVEMAKLRSHLTFTRSTVVAGEPVPWDSPLVPESLRKVVDHLIAQGAYKPFQGATVGHFACKLPGINCGACNGFGYTKGGPAGPWEKLDCERCGGTGKSPMQEFLTSQRKTNFNDLQKLGLVKVRTDGPDSVLAYGAKPSVGGQSQRILFGDHPEYDCVVHAHVPMKPSCGYFPGFGDYRINDIPTVSQREFECGSHQCGKNTSSGMKEFTLPSGHKLMTVFLAEHGPNILFHHSAPWQEICDFIDANFDLSKKTGGYVS